MLFFLIRLGWTFNQPTWHCMTTCMSFNRLEQLWSKVGPRPTTNVVAAANMGGQPPRGPTFDQQVVVRHRRCGRTLWPGYKQHFLFFNPVISFQNFIRFLVMLDVPHSLWNISIVIVQFAPRDAHPWHFFCWYLIGTGKVSFLPPFLDTIAY